jgi:DNA-binding ferritin-like protein (Dps family)
MRDLNHLSVSDLKSVAKYYKLEHKSRIKRVELEALIFLAEVQNGLEIVEGYNEALELIEVGEEDGVSLVDVSGADVSGSSP